MMASGQQSRYLPMSEQQKAVYDFLVRYFEEHGRSPKFVEIGEGAQVASHGQLGRILNNLEARGFITRVPGMKQSIMLLPQVPVVELKHATFQDMVKECAARGWLVSFAPIPFAITGTSVDAEPA